MGEAELKGLGQFQGDPFDIAKRVNLVLDKLDIIKKLDFDDVKKVSEVIRAAAGACGVACGGC